ncbi:MAG: sulfatase-like hydrolase/transferase [Verrucomicrobiales bacterium]|nr:sulfatase-like hydrolase/transferase [Verrucomicrobiales bacterium]
MRTQVLVLAAALPLLGFAADRPNVVVIFTDDQTFRGVGYQHPEVKTPHLDELAQSGIIFERAYVASPICAASRAAMMTGLFPQKNGVMALNSKAFAAYQEGGSKASRTLAARLSSAGYDTALYGKSHLGEPQKYGFQTGSELKDDDQTFENAAEFLRARGSSSKPFFLWLAPHKPHVPLFPEQEWLDLYPQGSIHLPKNFLTEPTSDSLNNQGTPGQAYYRDSNYRRNIDQLPAGPPRDEATMLAFVRAYYAVISRLDQQVGELAGLLRETGLMENTIVFYLSDNGYHLGSHGLGNKITMHEESVRVPMFAFGAGIEAGKISQALVSTLDLYPTLMELAGVSKLEEPPAGQSLLPLFKNPELEFRNTVFSECVGVGGTAGQGHRMARGDRWKLILSDTDEEFLFDQRDDPFELTNRISDPELKTIVEALRRDLAQWMKENGDRPYPGAPQ